MKLQRYALVAGLLASMAWPVTPAWGGNRDLIQLQTQVQNLQDQMTHMQQSFERDTDAINKATAAINNLSQTLQKQQADSGAHVDQLSGQIQSLNDSLDEL